MEGADTAREVGVPGEKNDDKRVLGRRAERDGAVEMALGDGEEGGGGAGENEEVSGCEGGKDIVEEFEREGHGRGLTGRAAGLLRCRRFISKTPSRHGTARATDQSAAKLIAAHLPRSDLTFFMSLRRFLPHCRAFLYLVFSRVFTFYRSISPQDTLLRRPQRLPRRPARRSRWQPSLGTVTSLPLPTCHCQLITLSPSKGKRVSFFPLKDSHGTTQLILSDPQGFSDLANVPLESSVLVQGTVLPRPQEAKRQVCCFFLMSCLFSPLRPSRVPLARLTSKSKASPF